MSSNFWNLLSIICISFSVLSLVSSFCSSITYIEERSGLEKEPVSLSFSVELTTESDDLTLLASFKLLNTFMSCIISIVDSFFFTCMRLDVDLGRLLF